MRFCLIDRGGSDVHVENWITSGRPRHLSVRSNPLKELRKAAV